MGLIDYNPFEGDSGNGVASHRPSLEHLDGIDKVNVPGGVPDPRHGVDARGWTVAALATEAAIRMARTLRLSVTFSGSTPSISGVTGMREISDVGAFAIGYSAGKTTITWASGFVPPPLCEPTATLNGTGFGRSVEARNIASGVEVYTGDDGSAAPIAFTVEVG